MLYLASDHAGYQLKKYLKRYLTTQLKIKVVDLGPSRYDPEDDYPLIAQKLAKRVAGKREHRGILICGTGHGVCLVANKVRGVRAGVGYNIEAAERGRKEDNLNVLCLAGRFLTPEHAAAIVKKFLATEFERTARYLRRLKEVEAIDA
ncbi:MAG: RpiB/LacA/LacB family sugar-phosphate isomerase [Candidatus Magasanikbacteria bacterium]|nr:RpiB/LacA/LacB family sugar-phosphate isomerase [Candidatus Magasanikbacteria bacterium]